MLMYEDHLLENAMVRRTTAATAKDKFDDLLRRVREQHESVEITDRGKTVAAMVDGRRYERLKKFDAEFDRMMGELGRAYEGVPADVAEAEIAEAVAAARRRTRARLKRRT